MDLLQSGTQMCIFPANYEFKYVKLFFELQVIKKCFDKKQLRSEGYKQTPVTC